MSAGLDDLIAAMAKELAQARAILADTRSNQLELHIATRAERMIKQFARACGISANVDEAAAGIKTDWNELGANLLTTEQAAEVLGVAPRTVANWRAQRTGPPYRRIGRAIRYDHATIVRWQQNRTEEVQP